MKCIPYMFVVFPAWRVNIGNGNLLLALNHSEVNVMF